MFFGAIIILACLVATTLLCWKVAMESIDRDFPLKQKFREWGIKGLAVPILVWALCNVGGTPIVPPLFAAGATGHWFFRFFRLLGGGILVIGSYWAAVWMAWLAVVIARKVSEKRSFYATAGFWVLVTLPLGIFILHIGGWQSAGASVLMWLLPVVYFSQSLVAKPKILPSYTRAVAKIKFGKYSEAESEVIQELERCENDFDGWMMLAELYANQFNDLPEAERTLRELCQQPDITGSQISIAFHRLADWYIKLRDDPMAARRSMEEIQKRLPGTHLARMAGLRMIQLPATEEEYREQKKTRSYRMPALSEDAPPEQRPAMTPGDRMDASERADLHVRRLQENSNDVVAREKLARIMAEELDRVEEGIDQLGLLLGLPDMEDKQKSAWLALAASWWINYRQDWDRAQKLLRQIVKDYPQTPEAFAAQRRLNLREMDMDRHAR